jgi:hypothetical protein
MHVTDLTRKFRYATLAAYFHKNETSQNFTQPNDEIPNLKIFYFFFHKITKIAYKPLPVHRLATRRGGLFLLLPDNGEMVFCAALYNTLSV